MIDDEEFLEYVRLLMLQDEMAQISGWVQVGLLAKTISQHYPFYSVEMAEFQIRKLEAHGRVRAEYADEILIGVYPS